MNTKLLLLAPVALALTGCAIETGASYDYQPAAAAPPRVYFFPTQGQSAEQQDRDRYDCHTWAVTQTGYDPSRRAVSPSERTVVLPARSGDTTLGAALTGAIIGAAVSNPRDAGSGALIGAAAGGLLGAAAEDAQAEESRRLAVASASAGSRRQSSDYQRAMSACLEGRGYTVK